MIWTIVCFFIALFVLKKYAFGPMQQMLDNRQSAIASTIQASEDALAEAQKLLEEHKRLIGEARGEAEGILAEARKTRESMERRMKDETEAERQRRLEQTLKEIEAETSRAIADPGRGRRPHARGCLARRRQDARRRA